jgi:osmotically-inducible protein OsmY
MRTTRLRLGLVTLVAALACSGSDPEAELIEASQAVEQARSRVETARANVEKRETEAEEAKQRLTEARTVLREAQENVTKYEASVDRNATDSVLFRAVQKRLLEDRQLKDVAIAARVDKGIVTLSGNVPNAKLRDRALEIAQQTPGVNRVESLIDVPVAARKPAAD